MTLDVFKVVRWVATPFAAVLGGLAASALLGSPPILVGAGVGLLVGFLVAVIDSQLSAKGVPADRTAPDWNGDRPYRSAIPTLTQRPPLYGVVPAFTAERPSVGDVSRPQERGSTGQAEPRWWGDATLPVASPTVTGTPRPTPDLSSYLRPGVAGRRIPQCPRCGDFTVAADTSNTSQGFFCQGCGKRWSWTPGIPWPAVRLNPRLRR